MADAVSSPTELIQQYLASKNLKPTSENTRRALEANAQNPGTIKGLVNDTASTDANGDSKGGSAGSKSPDRGKSIARAIEGGDIPDTPPAPPGDPKAKTASPDTPAAPTADGSGGGVDMPSIIKLILGGAGGTAGAIGGNKLAGFIQSLMAGGGAAPVANPADDVIGDISGLRVNPSGVPSGELPAPVAQIDANAQLFNKGAGTNAIDPASAPITPQIGADGKMTLGGPSAAPAIAGPAPTPEAPIAPEGGVIPIAPQSVEQLGAARPGAVLPNAPGISESATRGKVLQMLLQAAQRVRP